MRAAIALAIALAASPAYATAITATAQACPVDGGACVTLPANTLVEYVERLDTVTHVRLVNDASGKVYSVVNESITDD